MFIIQKIVSALIAGVIEVVVDWKRLLRRPKSLYTPSQYLIMVMKMAELPIAPVNRLMRNAGAERVSEDASQALVDVIEEYGEKVATKAVSLAKHAGRKTVKKEDIQEAVGEISEAKPRGRPPPPPLEEGPGPFGP